MKSNTTNAGVGLAVGVALGTALGAALHQIAVGVAIGIALGLLVPSVLDRNSDDAKPGQTGNRSPETRH